MFRFKDVLCEVSDQEFMMNDEQGTVVSDYELFAIKDDDIWKDLEVASKFAFDMVTLIEKDSLSMEILSLEKALCKYGRTNNC